MKKMFLLFSLSIAALILAGCTSTKEVKKEEVPPPPPVVKKPTDPDLVLRVASINLSKLSRRIEVADLEGIRSSLRSANIEIVTLQGVTRYPNVSTRIDVIDSLAAQLEMRKLFGETIDLSGRQSGNAILSAYPIKSDENSHYEGLRSNNFEAALQAVIDCGVRDIVIVSTGIPEPLTGDDKRTVANKMSSFGIQYLSDPMIITGNLPSTEELRTSSQYSMLKPMNFSDAPRMWYSVGGVVKLLGQKIATTPLGPMTIAEFGLFRNPPP